MLSSIKHLHVYNTGTKKVMTPTLQPLYMTLPRFGYVQLDVSETCYIPLGTQFSAPTSQQSQFILSSTSSIHCQPIQLSILSAHKLHIEMKADWLWSEKSPLTFAIISHDRHTTISCLNELLSASFSANLNNQLTTLTLSLNPIESIAPIPQTILTHLMNQPERNCFICLYPEQGILIDSSFTICIEYKQQPVDISLLTNNCIPVENRLTRPSEPIQIQRTQLEYPTVINHPFEKTVDVRPLHPNQHSILSASDAFWGHGQICSIPVECEQTVETASCDLSQLNFLNKDYTSVQCIRANTGILSSIPACLDERHESVIQQIVNWDYLIFNQSTDWLHRWRTMLSLHQRQSCDLIENWVLNHVDCQLKPLGESRLNINLKLKEPSCYDKLAKQYVQYFFRIYRPINLHICVSYEIL